MKLIPKDVININLNFESKTEVLDFMIKNLVEKDYVSDSNLFFTDIMSRENETSTNIGSGIAIPHTRSSSVIRPIIAYVRNNCTIDWGDPNEQGVNHIFMFAFGDDPASIRHYLSVLQDIATILASSEKIEALETFQTIEEFMEIMDV